MEKFIQLLQDIQVEGLFNSFTDVCFHHDKDDADEIRTRNLREYLKATETTDTCIMGEAGGYLGYRRTGLAFCDNLQLDNMSKRFGLNKFEVATKSGDNKEASASFVWNVIMNLKNPPFIWNSNPMHPHKSGNELSNRKPNSKDYKAVQEAMEYFLDRFNFKKYYAVGRVAETFLLKNGYDVIYIRHPSYGGSTIFTDQMYEYFERI